MIRQGCKKLRIITVFNFQESMQNHLHARKEDRLLVLSKGVAPLNFSSVHDVIQDRSIKGRKQSTRIFGRSVLPHVIGREGGKA